MVHFSNGTLGSLCLAGLVAGTLTGKGVGGGAAVGLSSLGNSLMFFSMWIYFYKDIKKLEDEEMTSLLGK